MWAVSQHSAAVHSLPAACDHVEASQQRDLRKIDQEVAPDNTQMFESRAVLTRPDRWHPDTGRRIEGRAATRVTTVTQSRTSLFSTGTGHCSSSLPVSRISASGRGPPSL